MNNKLKEIKTILSKSDDVCSKWFSKFFIKHKDDNFISLLNEIFSPEYNGNQMMNLDMYYNSNFANREIWFDNSCIFIHKKLLDIY